MLGKLQFYPILRSRKLRKVLYIIRFFNFSYWHHIVLTWLLSNFALFWSPNLTHMYLMCLSEIIHRPHRNLQTNTAKKRSFVLTT